MKKGNIALGVTAAVAAAGLTWAVGRRRSPFSADVVSGEWTDTGRTLRQRLADREARRQLTADAGLARRARRALSRVVTSPEALDVTVYNGLVTLSGPISRLEADAALAAVAALSGVAGVENALDFLPSNQDIAPPGLEVRSAGRKIHPAALYTGELLTALLALFGGYAVLRRYGLRALPLTLGGAAVAATAISREPRRARLSGRSGRGLEYFRSMDVRAPSDSLHDFFSRFEDLPGFVRHLHKVERTGQENEWRWTIAGTTGNTVTYTAWVTENVPGKVIAWESAPGAPVRAAGVIHFLDKGDGTSRVDLRLSYRPGSGDGGTRLTDVLDAGVLNSLDEDLTRIQQYLDASELPTNRT